MRVALGELAAERVELREKLGAVAAQEAPLKQALRDLRSARESSNGASASGGNGGTGKRIYRRKRTPMATQRTRVRDYLREHGPASQGEIRDALDIASSTCSKVLQNLRDTGKVEQAVPGGPWGYKPDRVHVGEGVQD